MDDFDARAAGLMATLMQDPDFERMAARLKGLIGTPRRDELQATIAQAESMMQSKLFNRRERRDHHGRWTDGAVTHDSHVHTSRPSFTADQVSKLSGSEADRYVRNAQQHVDSLQFQRHQHNADVTPEQVASAEKWLQTIKAAADKAHSSSKPKPKPSGKPVAPAPYFLGGP